MSKMPTLADLMTSMPSELFELVMKKGVFGKAGGDGGEDGGGDEEQGEDEDGGEAPAGGFGL